MFSDIIVPGCYTFEGTVFYKRNFTVPDSVLNKYCFLLVAEGINYESEIKINNLFVSKTFGGAKSFVIPLEDNVIKNQNEIYIKVNNLLNNLYSIPLANQINFTRNYGGINKDIYILAVPKVYIFESFHNWKFENDNTVRITSSVEINSNNIADIKAESKEFFVRTKLYKRNGTDEVGESTPVKLNIEDYQSANLSAEFVIRNINPWSPDNPELYLLKTVIFNSSNKIIDEQSTELGFANLKFNPEFVTLNGKNITLNGINYYEDSPRFGSALDYGEVESDLRKIKEYGFNCIRVPGKSSHPYIVNACSRIGLFLMQEIPFNEVPERVLSDNNYANYAIDYLETIIKRDKHSPAVICWGIGNDFDVTTSASVNYVRSIKEAAGKLDQRPVYYTTRNISKDKCSESVDLKGINISIHNFEKIQDLTTELKASGRQNAITFISSYGLCIDNENRNGFGDRHSVESQAKFLSESFKIVSKSFFANFVSSYADWNAESPLNMQLNPNPYLKTDGIFDFYREPKMSASILKRLINGQGYQKIPEGSGEIMKKDNFFVFIITGLVAVFFFIFLLGKLRYFKQNIAKSLISPKNFLYFVKEQMLIAAYRNIILNFLIALSLGLFFASLIYLYRENPNLDMLIASIFTDPGTKMNIAIVINSPVNLLLLISVAVYLVIVLITGISFLVNAFFIKKCHLNTIYTVTVWSLIPFMIFLIIGTVIYKLSGSNSVFLDVSLVLFVLIYFYSYIKLMHGYKVIFELSTLKSFLYGIFIFIFVHVVSFAYFYYVKSTLSVFNLILSY
ncbi:MAG: hypothetical protein HY959_14250 [Ignavibacteriae bacterium]|nr:hypothetical protein [Ignavibacteriota bacterium]